MRACAVLATLAVLAGGAGAAQTITDARFTDPTERYAHAVLGDAIEYGGLEIDVTEDGATRTLQIKLPLDHVFEDVTPRLWDVTGDGAPEVVVVETDVSLGGALAIYGLSGKITETPHIGQRNRWLAPVGAADLDGDGVIEVAYIDRPHLAKTLRVWRFEEGALRQVGAVAGLTNHRIGEPDIAGGIRLCDARPEMILARADWSRLVAVTFDGGSFAARDIGPHAGRPSFAKALECG